VGIVFSLGNMGQLVSGRGFCVVGSGSWLVGGEWG